MKHTDWIAALLVGIVLLVGLLLGRSALLLATIIILAILGLWTVIILIRLLRQSRESEWIVFASTYPELEGMSMEEVEGAELAALLKANLEVEQPKPFVIFKDSDGNWQSMFFDENEAGGDEDYSSKE